MTLLPRFPPLPHDAHKGSAGRVVCYAGSRTMPGAAILAVRAAQRAGAGLVVAGLLDPELLGVVPIAAPEAVLADQSTVFARESAHPTEHQAGPQLVDELLPRDPHALLCGPGLGDDARTRRVVASLCGQARVPLVLDADGLNALDGQPERLADRAGEDLVLTPHPGEARRLLGREIPADAAGRAEAAHELAERARAVVCLKGSGTLVCDGRRSWTNPSGNPGLATAGSGDVLAGMLVAYLARGRGALDAYDCARWAVFVHGLAGDLAAVEHGPRALVASDLLTTLGPAQRRAGIDAEASGPSTDVSSTDADG